MTTATVATTAPTPAEVSTATTLRRAIAAEFTRLTSLRSTWWSLTAAATMFVLMAIAFAAGSEGREVVTVPGEAGLLFAQFALYVPVVLSVTSAYATRSIRTTLQGVPRRGVLLASRWTVYVLAVTMGAMVLVVVSDGLAALLLGSLAGADAGSVVRSIAAVGAVMAVASTIALGLAFSLRSSAVVITGMFLLMLVLPLLLPVFGIDVLTTVSRHTPGKAMFSLLDAFNDETALSPLRAWTVLVAWSTAALAAGAVTLMRRDAA